MSDKVKGSLEVKLLEDNSIETEISTLGGDEILACICGLVDTVVTTFVDREGGDFYEVLNAVIDFLRETIKDANEDAEIPFVATDDPEEYKRIMKAIHENAKKD